MKAYHVLEEIVTFSSLIVHKDHTKYLYLLNSSSPGLEKQRRCFQRDFSDRELVKMMIGSE